MNPQSNNETELEAQLASLIVAHANSDLATAEQTQREALPICLPDDLNNIGALIEVLIFGTDDIRPAAQVALVAIGDEATANELLKALSLALETEGIDESALDELCVTLKEIGEVAFQVLLQALKSKRTNIPATYALGRMGNKRAVEPLLEALQSKQPRLQASAALALGELQDLRAVAPLTELFNTSSKYTSVRDAAMALARLGAFEPLLEKLKNEATTDVKTCFWEASEVSGTTPNSSRKSFALEALSRYGDSKVLSMLQKD